MLDEWFLNVNQRKEMKTIMSLEKAQIGEVRKAGVSPRVPAIPSERARTARIRQKKVRRLRSYWSWYPTTLLFFLFTPRRPSN